MVNPRLAETPTPLFKNSRPRLERFRKIRARDSGPLHMSPVNRAGSVSETLSFVKFSMCSYETLGWPGYRDLGFCDRDLGNRDENFPI